MVSDHGFHYGIDVRLPARTQTIKLSIGRATMRLAGTARERLRKVVTVEFDWAAVPR
jgi:hypothetical protein